MSLLGNLFSKKPKEADPDFVNPVHTDFHSHFIPGIDDGVQYMEQAIQILGELSKLGYRKVITTPHVMGDFYKNGPHNILPGLEKVRQELKTNNIDIQLDAAAEYLVDELLEEKIEKKELLTFGNNYVLIELPFSTVPGNLNSALFKLQLAGYNPVLAHPERYEYMGEQRNKYEELKDAGIILQLNIFSLVGYYSGSAQKNAEYLVANKLVSLLGSDMHIPLHIPVLKHVLKSYQYQKACELDLLNNTL
jgi:protein-tyrosine phosphatase